MPKPCADLTVTFLECAIQKRDAAMKIAEELAGKDGAHKVFPYYEDSRKKALDLIETYKEGVAGSKDLKDNPFWG